MKYNYFIAEPLLNKNRNKDYKLAAKKMIDSNLFFIPPYGRVPIDIEDNFKVDNSNRSLNRLIHNNSFLGDLYTSYFRTNDKKYVIYSEYVMNKWFDYKELNLDYRMVYHDETTAQRMLYWLNFYYLCSDVFSEKFRLRLIKEIDETAALLLTENFHSTGTNHGMFQDIALLAYSLLKFEYPKESIEYETSIRRLSDYFKDTYTSDGIHKEHSPDYHFMVTAKVKKIADVVQQLSIKRNEHEDFLRDIYYKAEKYALHIIKPNLYLPNISDCSGFNINNKTAYSNLFNSPEFRYIKTSGIEGNKPQESQVLFKNSGYFISRSGWSVNDTYFLFLASYHAQYHKHSDDLSFVLYKDGDIFTDTGPNGYDYDSPYTKYAYSGYAHSNLIVNGRSLERYDGRLDLVGIEKAEINEDKQEFRVRGFNKRYIHTEHYRTIKGNHKTSNYEIIDDIISENRNEYLINFQLSHTIETVINGNIVSLLRDNKKIAELEIEFQNISGVPIIDSKKGEKYPYYQGFEFQKMGEATKSSTIVVKFYNNNNETRMKTTIRLSNFKIKSELSSKDNRYGVNNVKYNLYEPELSSSNLLVVFSSLLPKYEYNYSHHHTLKGFPSYQLYIKDDIGKYGDYYISRNKNTDIQTEIISLIYNIIRKYKIPLENVTLIGTSKGGFTALYYGMKYGFSNVIVGSPQTKLGNFILEEAPYEDIAKIVSGSDDIGDKLYLNSLIYDLDIINNDFSRYYICVGSLDHHLMGHVNPFINHLSRLGHNINYKTIPNSNQYDLKSYFKDYVYESLNEIYGTELSFDKNYINNFMTTELTNYSLQRQEKNGLIINLEITGRNYNVLYYILNNKNEIIYRSKPQKDTEIKLNLNDIIGNRLKLFIRNSETSSIYITPIIRDIDLFTFNSSS